MATQQKEKNYMGSGMTTAESATDTVTKTGEAVKGAASTVAHAAADAGSFIAHKAEDATSAVGGEMKSVALAMRDKGPHGGMLGSANSAVANTLESAGRELQEHGLTGIADDITNAVRRHPVPALLIGIGVGFLLARVLVK